MNGYGSCASTTKRARLTRVHIEDARTYDEPRHIDLTPDNKRAYW